MGAEPSTWPTNVVDLRVDVEAAWPAMESAAMTNRNGVVCRADLHRTPLGTLKTRTAIPEAKENQNQHGKFVVRPIIDPRMLVMVMSTKRPRDFPCIWAA